MSRKRAFAGLSCLPLWAACAIGSPIVDDAEPDLGIDTLECHPPPVCESRKLPKLELPPHTPIDQRCSGQALCSPARASSDDAAPADAATPCASEPLEALPLAAECSKQTLYQRDGTSELSYAGMRWTNVELRVEATAPLRISLDAAELSSVAMHLSGPVALTLQNTKPKDVRIFGVGNEAGEPSVSLVNVNAEQVRVGDVEHRFQGVLRLRASKLRVLELRVKELDLESSRLEVGVIDASGFSAADTALIQLDVATEHALFAEFETQESRFKLCEYASFIGGRIDATTLDACPGTLVHIYATTVTSSELEGAFLSDDSNFENALFGATSNSRLISYQSRITSTSLCGQLELLALDASSRVKCSDCDRSFEDNQHACEFPRDPNSDSPLQANFCATLARGRSLPQCNPAVPERSRKR